MPKIYYINGRVVTITDGGTTKIFTTPDDFNFEVVTDVHGQVDVFSRVCAAMNNYLPDGGPGDFIWTTGDTTAGNFQLEIYPLQFGPEQIRGVIDDFFGVNYPFYLSVGNHEITDIVGVIALEKNSMPWIRSEYTDIADTTIFTRENSGWTWKIATISGGYPDDDDDGDTWRESDYDVGDVDGWSDDATGAIGFGEIWAENPSLDPPPVINTTSPPTADDETITWCFRREFTIADQDALDSNRTVRIETLYDEEA